MILARSIFLCVAVCSLMLAADPAPLPIEVPVGVYQRGERYDVVMQVPFDLKSLNTLLFQFDSAGRPTVADWYYVNRIKLDDALKAALAIPGFLAQGDLKEDGMIFKVAQKDELRFQCRLSVAAENPFGVDKISASVTNSGKPLPVIRVEAAEKAPITDGDAFQFPDPACLLRPYPGMDRIITGHGLLTSCMTQCMTSKEGISMSYIMFFSPTIKKDAYIAEFLKRYPEFTKKQEGPGIALESALAKGSVFDAGRGYFMRLDRKQGAKPRQPEGTPTPKKDKAKK